MPGRPMLLAYLFQALLDQAEAFLQQNLPHIEPESCVTHFLADLQIPGIKHVYNIANRCVHERSRPSHNVEFGIDSFTRLAFFQIAP